MLEHSQHNYAPLPSPHPDSDLSELSVVLSLAEPTRAYSPEKLRS